MNEYTINKPIGGTYDKNSSCNHYQRGYKGKIDYTPPEITLTSNK